WRVGALAGCVLIEHRRRAIWSQRLFVSPVAGSVRPRWRNTQFNPRSPALEGDRQSVKNFTEEIRRRRDLATKRVAAIDGLSCLVPEAAFYLMIHVADMDGRTDTQVV